MSVLYNQLLYWCMEYTVFTYILSFCIWSVYITWYLMCTLLSHCSVVSHYGYVLTVYWYSNACRNRSNSNTAPMHTLPPRIAKQWTRECCLLQTPTTVIPNRWVPALFSRGLSRYTLVHVTAEVIIIYHCYSCYCCQRIVWEQSNQRQKCYGERKIASFSNRMCI